LNARVWFSVFCAAAEEVAKARRATLTGPSMMAEINRDLLERDTATLHGAKVAKVATQVFDDLLHGARNELRCAKCGAYGPASEMQVVHKQVWCGPCAPEGDT
jgi:formylmethanofuran dehydrogenase subunit E